MGIAVGKSLRSRSIDKNMETIETKHTIDLSNRMYKLPIALISVLAVFLAGYLVYSFKALPQNAPREINVSGEGRAYAKPDVAMISFGAHTEAKKSQDAVNENNKIMNAVIKSIKDLGVEDKDIQTTLYNLMPLYDYGVVPMMYSYPVSNKRTFKGYSLDQQIMVKIRNFDKISEIMDKAALNGANTIGELQFTVDNMEKVRAEARSKAIAQAKEKASGMFSAAGLSRTKIVNISEGYSNYPQSMYATVMEMKDSDSTAPSIQTGQEEINVTVTLTYQVK